MSSWTCDRCTYSNQRSAQQCEMCDGPKPSSPATWNPPPSSRQKKRGGRGRGQAVAPLSRPTASPSSSPSFPSSSPSFPSSSPSFPSSSPSSSPFSPAARSSRGAMSGSGTARPIPFAPSSSPSPVSGQLKTSGVRDSQRGGRGGSEGGVRLSRLEMERAQRSALKSSSAVGGTQSRVAQAVKEVLEQDRIRSEERAKEEQQLLASRIREETERTNAQLQAAQSAAQKLRSQLAASSSAVEKRPVRILSSQERRDIQAARQSAFQASEKLRQEEFTKRMGTRSSSSSSSSSSTQPGAPFSPVTELDQMVVNIYMNRPSAATQKDKKMPKVPLKKLHDGKYMFGTKVVQVKSEFGEVFVNSTPGTTFATLLDQLEALEARKMQALGAARGIIVA